MKEIGHSLKKIVAGDYDTISVSDVITDLQGLMDDIEKFAKHCEKPDVLMGKGKDEQHLARLRPAALEFKKALNRR